jgi:hypothetical protein
MADDTTNMLLSELVDNAPRSDFSGAKTAGAAGASSPSSFLAGLSPNAKVGLGVAAAALGVVVVGAIAYAIYAVNKKKPAQ